MGLQELGKKFGSIFSRKDTSASLEPKMQNPTKSANEFVDKGDTDEDILLSQGEVSAFSVSLNDMDVTMRQLCQYLSHSTDSFNCNEWLKALDDYIRKYDRLLYTKISDYIFSLSDDKQIGIFMTNIDKAIETKINKSPGTPMDGSSRILIKFRDHAQLAYSQRRLLMQREADITDLITKQLEPKLAQSSKELTSQLVGLVAIFTALSFIVFGGISSLSSILQVLSQKENSILPTLIVVIGWAFCILNLLFAFMYFILRIVKPTLMPSDQNSEKNLVQKYPVVFVCNYCLGSALLLCFGILGMEQIGINQALYDFISSYRVWTFWAFPVAIVALIILVGIILWFRFKDGKSK